VTLIERDAPPDAPETRMRVPQGRHAHALLARGDQILSRLFPGLTDDLVAGGAFSGDMGSEMKWFQFGGYKLQHTWGRKTFTQWSGTAVAGLLTKVDRVMGVDVQRDGAEVHCGGPGGGLHGPRVCQPTMVERPGVRAAGRKQHRGGCGLLQPVLPPRAEPG
jgi:hypothetical protein